MGLKAVKKYYLECQEQYLEMLKDAKDFDDAIKQGLIDQSQFDQAQTLLNRVKENYERLSFIMYLFSQPNRSSKVAKFNNQNKNLNNYFEGSSASSQYVMKENDDVLKEFKKLMGVSKK